MTEVHWSAFENPLKSYPIIYLTVYYKDCKLPYDTGPDKISIMVIFNNVAIFILTFPFFILQTPLPLLSHISVTGSLKIQTQIQQSTQDAMYRNLQDEPADLVLSQGKKKQPLTLWAVLLTHENNGPITDHHCCPIPYPLFSYYPLMVRVKAVAGDPHTKILRPLNHSGC